MCVQPKQKRNLWDLQIVFEAMERADCLPQKPEFERIRKYLALKKEWQQKIWNSMDVFINTPMDPYAFEIKDAEDYDEKKHALGSVLRR